MQGLVKPNSNVSSSSTAKGKLRYPLRSATKTKKDDKSPADKSTATSAIKREKSASNLSRSVSAVTPSSKEKSASNISRSASALTPISKEKAAPRRLSIPGKSAISPLPKSTGKITSTSETRSFCSTNGQQKKESPVSDGSKIVIRKKFSTLSSTSYWLSQIKVSESAAKHSVSLGFFKLAMEAECENLQRLREELKSYVLRHNLVELGEPVKELLTSYNVLEDLEKAQSEEASSVVESAKKQSAQRIAPIKNKKQLSSNTMRSISVGDVGNAQKISQRQTRQEGKKEKMNSTKIQGKKSAGLKDPVEDLPSAITEQEDKENKDAQAQQPEEISMTEVM